MSLLFNCLLFSLLSAKSSNTRFFTGVFSVAGVEFGSWCSCCTQSSKRTVDPDGPLSFSRVFSPDFSETSVFESVAPKPPVSRSFGAIFPGRCSEEIVMSLECGSSYSLEKSTILGRRLRLKEPVGWPSASNGDLSFFISRADSKSCA